MAQPIYNIAALSPDEPAGIITFHRVCDRIGVHRNGRPCSPLYETLDAALAALRCPPGDVVVADRIDGLTIVQAAQYHAWRAAADDDARALAIREAAPLPIEAAARIRQIAKGRWSVPSSDGARVYAVQFHQGMVRGDEWLYMGDLTYAEWWTCTCPAGEHGRKCKHVRAVQAAFVAETTMDVALASGDVDECDAAEHGEDNGQTVVRFVPKHISEAVSHA